LQVFLPAVPVVLEADEPRLREAVDNLVNNAIKFSPLDRTVEITLSSTEQQALIQVRDHGPGLTEEDLSSIFTPYQRLSAIPTAGEISIGIGLSIVKQMVELHGGRAWAESRPGEGAAFYLELPAGRPEA
ncbi:MAG TPA: ATP-binding protein, partial [Holophaga sp.]|nr:ATP-binding protein [Holophaga sp.]